MEAELPTATLPEDFRPARVIDGKVQTCKHLQIGAMHTPDAQLPEIYGDAEMLQSALLEPRTARPLPLILRAAGAAWRWL